MKKQVTIDGKDSDWYEKAIFILKDKKESHIPDHLFWYAEDIIESYLKKNPVELCNKYYNQKQQYIKKEGKKKAYKKKGPNSARMVNLFLDFSLIICGISFIALIVIFYF